VSDHWRVPLPSEAEPPYRVWVNGVPQEEGRDYRVRDRALCFERPLAQEGRLGFWRWLSIFLGLVGTYRRDDSVDVQYRVGGRERLATRLDIEPPAGAVADGPERPRRSGA
jgi:hypothetical protein